MVTDPPGAVIANAEVTFKNKVTSEVTVVRTAVDGFVHLKLPYGRYDVTLVSPGFRTTKIVDFFVETEKGAALRVVLQIDPVVHDSYPGEEALVPTIVSDLPNVIGEILSAQSTEFIGNWRPDHWNPRRRHLGIVLLIERRGAGIGGKVHFYDPRGEHESIMLNPKLSAGTFVFDVDDEYVGRKLWFSMTVERGGRSAVVKGGGGEMLLDFNLVKQP
jgi:hypothetical protein